MSPKVSPEHKERRRQNILDAALDVFIGKGYQLATVNDISDRCHLSVGAIYRYFPNKSAIMLTLVEERLGRMPELYARHIPSGGDPWQRLQESIDLFISALRVRHPATGRLLLATLAEAVHDSEVRHGLQERFGGLARYLRAIVDEGVAQGLFRSGVDTAALAALLLCLADGVAVYWVTGTREVDLRPMRGAVSEMLKAYLIPKE